MIASNRTTPVVRRRFLPSLIAAAVMGCSIISLGPITATATISATGDISPAPPVGGGNVAAPFRVGITGRGVLAMNGGTPLSVTGGNAIFGDGTMAVGLISMTGLNTDLTTEEDLIIGGGGSSSVIASALARIIVTDDLILGSAAGSSGSLNISDQGTSCSVVDAVTIGNGGQALLQVSTAGQLVGASTVLGNTTTGDGHLTVSGLFSSARFTGAATIGAAGKGIMEVSSQGRIESSSAIIGNSPTGHGTVNVGSGGSLWSVASTLNVGVNGQGYLNVLSGGRATIGGVTRLAMSSASEAHVDVVGTDAILSIANNFIVADSGFSTLKVRQGGRLNSGNVTIADNTGSRGEVLVDGSDSIWDITGTLQVSAPGEAELTISNNGLVAVSGLTTVDVGGRLTLGGGRIDATGGLNNLGVVHGSGRVAGAITNSGSGEIRTKTGETLVTGGIVNQGLISMEGGELETTGATINNVDIEAHDAVLRFKNGLTNNASAQLAITGGNTSVYGAITNNLNGQVVIGGQSHTSLHDNFTNFGKLLVTPGSELLTLENLTFGEGASLSLQLQGADPRSAASPIDGFGQLQVGGTTTLAGALNVSLLPGFTPEEGDTFQFLVGQYVTGTFGSTNLPTLTDGLNWSLQYEASSVTLAVVTGLPGDYNQNGTVDAADYVLYRNNAGTTNMLPNDPIGGTIGTAQYDQWRAHFGQTAGSGSSSALPLPSSVFGTAVPEPLSLTLLFWGVTIYFKVRRR